MKQPGRGTRGRGPRGGRGRGGVRGKGGYRGKPKVIDSGEAKRKWLHHCLKTLQKVLKKAKLFEIRKLTRRIAQAKDGKKGAGSHEDGASIPKLQSQLDAAKNADLVAVAKLLALKAGLTDSPAPAAPTSPQQEEGAGPSSDAGASPAAAPPANASAAPDAEAGPSGQEAPAPVSGVVAVVQQRLMRAGCVRKQVDESRREFQEKFNKGVALPAMPEGSDSGASSEDDGEASEGEGGDKEHSSGSRGKEGPPEEVTDPMALAALEKLKSCRKRPAADVGGAGEESDDDSGIIDWNDLQGEGEASEEGPGGDEDEQPSNSEGAGAGSEDDGSEGESDSGSGFNSEDFDALPGEAAASSKRSAAGAGAAASSKPAAKGDKADKPAKKQKLDAEQQGKQKQKEKEKQQGKRKRDAYDPRDDDPLLASKNKKKNRMGQHARRKMAEQMYGFMAKHLQAAGGAAEGPHGKGRGKGKGPERQQKPQRGAPAVAAEPKAAAKAAPKPKGQGDEAELHPSWAARKKQQQQALHIPAAPTGKKVVFGDDGAATTTSAPQVQKAAQQTTDKQAKPQAPKPSSAQSLHPSWAAKQAAKEKLAAMAAGAAGGSKKIVFDD